MQPVDLLILARWVLPMDPAGLVIEHGGVAVRDGRIVEVGERHSLLARLQPAQTIERDGHALLPGLVNAHTHAAMSLLRDLPLEGGVQHWLRTAIWPLEQRWVSAEFVRTGTQLYLAQLQRCGVTSMADMYFFPEEVARLAGPARMRIRVGVPVADAPTPWSENAADALERGAALWDELRGDPWAQAYFAPHSPYVVGEPTLLKLRTLVDQLDAPVAMHLHETATEIAASLREHGQRPVAWLGSLGLLRPGFTAVHMVHADGEDLAALARSGTAVVHCPRSNLALGSGIAPLAALRAHGITVGLGSDGPASAAAPDLLAEARLAALLAAGLSGAPGALSAHQALELATLGGARALGLSDRIGSLTCGKDADVIAVDLQRHLDVPTRHVANRLLDEASAADVSDCWVAGELVLENRISRTHDIADLRERARFWSQRLGLGPNPVPTSGAPA